MKYSFFFISLIVLISSCGAFEPPTTLVEDAITKGNVAFIGRIVKLEEISDSDFESTAIADVKIYQVFYGLTAKKGTTVKIRYYSKVFSESPNPGFPADLQISDVILFVLNNKSTREIDKLYFNSYWKNPHISNAKIDLAYYASSSPYEQYSEKQIAHKFVSIYMPGCNSRVTLNNFFKLAKKRKRELDTQHQ